MPDIRNLELFRSRLALAAAAVVALLIAFKTRADLPDDILEEPTPPVGRVTPVERTGVFVKDPSTPSGGGLTVTYDVSQGSAPNRVLPITLGSEVPQQTITASYGITDRVSPYVTSVFSQGVTASFMGGLTLQVTPSLWPFRLSFSAGALHDGRSADYSATTGVSVACDQGPLRLGGNVEGEHVFAPGHDPVDAMVILASSLRVLPFMRWGGEYVGHALNEAFAGGALAGASHSFGPDVAFDVDGGRYQLVAAAMFGTTSAAPHAAMLRAGLSLNL